VIRVAVLDDHAAVRAGLEAILGAAPEMVSVGSAQDEAELDRLLRRTDPSVLASASGQAPSFNHPLTQRVLLRAACLTLSAFAHRHVSHGRSAQPKHD
jgi:chemotaxis response regulator CheB